MNKLMIGTDEVIKIMLGEDEVSSIVIDGETIPFSPPTPPTPSYSAMPFTIEILPNENLVDGKISLKPSNGSLRRKFNYSINGGTQVLLEVGGSTSAIDIPVNSGDIIEFIAAEDQNGTANGDTINISIDGNAGTFFKVYGNILSLSYVDYSTGNTIAGYAYSGLFKSSLRLKDAENLIIPNVTLGNDSFYSMFSDATQLEVPPQLEPTSLTDSCYINMFRGCTSLTTAPVLPATTLPSSCYKNMFYGCTSLTTAPVLPITIASNDSCNSMFYGCTGLTAAPALPATTLGNGCYRNMFYNCTGLLTAPALPANTLATSCYRNMFYGCTGLIAAPELLAPTLVNYCYNSMFKGCSQLNYIKCLATDISASNCLTDWVNGVSATGTFVKDTNTTWTSGVNGIPDNWTIVNA